MIPVNADIVAQMRREEADLNRKLKAVRDFLAAYGEGPQESPVAVRPRAASIPPVREKVEITSFTEQTRTSVVLAMQCMAVDGRLKKTRELVQFIQAMGHKVSGNNPVNALGALLARSIDVEGHGKSGWSLVDRDKALAIIRQYAPKGESEFDELLTDHRQEEKEPESDNASGSDAGQGGVAAPTYPWKQPSDQSAYS